ncbi:DUF2914 domain-containing protein [candidate division GN15 bacterium]|nr:DUF2914 domain-containing protein [candidate division GN15 bacterium]
MGLLGRTETSWAVLEGASGSVRIWALPALLVVLVVGILLAGNARYGMAEESKATAEPCKGYEMSVQACLALDVKDREPQWKSDVFEEYVGKIYCWTRVIGVPDSTTITHIWVHDTTEMARVPLRVGSPSWRTWSFKTVPRWGKGRWVVRIADCTGTVFDSVTFKVLSESQMWNAPIVPPGYTSRQREENDKAEVDE